MQNQSLKFDYSDEDKNLLKNAIDCVLALNEAIRRASERFDGVPPITYTVTNKTPDESIEDYKIDSEWLKDSWKNEGLTIFSKLTKKGKDEIIVTSPIRVKNQISFCSKFLHFCFPQTVFIIDQYSFDGGKRMMMTSRRGNMKNGTLMYGEDSLKITEGISEIIKAELKFEDESVAKFESYVKEPGDGNLDEKVTAEAEEQSAKDYVEHCLRAYALCAYMKKKGIKPEKQVKNKEESSSYPRLADAVFMSVKVEGSKETKSSLTEQYKNIYPRKEVFHES